MASITKPRTANVSQAGVAMSGSDHFDLTPMIEQTNCLNEDTTNSHSNILNDGTGILESDAGKYFFFFTFWKKYSLILTCISYFKYKNGENNTHKMSII
jgi:hypothetical protein